MLYAVLKMRFAIKTMPNLLPDENLVAVHLLRFTAVTGLWGVNRVLAHPHIKTQKAHYKDPSDGNFLNWLLAAGDYLPSHLVYETAKIFLNLYMLHRFSVF